VSIINQLLYLIKSKHEHFLFIELDFYKTWKYLIKFLVYTNKNYIPCTIYKKEFKAHKNIVVVGLKWNGKNVKRRTTGFAKEFLDGNKNSRCLYCNQKLTKTNITTDHIIPLSKGGNNCQVNLVACCTKCNNERGNMDFYEYLKLKNPKRSHFL
jgi:hypothetical protein